jgi:glycosyltransferase involved in cell wall biosynthesis
MNSDSSTDKYPLSVIIITRDEERNIKECLESVAWANEIIVVDAQSKDRTVEYAKRYTSEVFVTEWLGYAEAKNFALSKTANRWVLWLDADERVPQELAADIQSIISADSNQFAGYDVARRAFFLGRWIKHCGWYPGYVVRFFKKEGARFNDARVHEKLELAGTVGRLQHDLLHYTDDNLFHYFSKFNTYTSLAAEDLDIKGRAFSILDLITRPPFFFFKMYILRLGFLDGIQGFILCILSATYVFTKYAKLWEREEAKRSE